MQRGLDNQLCRMSVAATTFADLTDVIKRIAMVVQGRTLGICEGVATLGAGPASVTVTQLTPSLGGSTPIVFSKAAGFDASATQCYKDSNGGITALFNVDNQDLQGLFLTADICAPRTAQYCTVDGKH
jgi:hypothetical protein